MKRNHIILEITDTGIHIVNKKKIITISKMISVNNFKVINNEIFIQELKGILEEYKINNNILTDNITIIVPNNYINLEINNIKSIFKDLSFNIIEVVRKSKFLEIEKKEILIEINYSDIYIYFTDKVIYTNYLYNKNIEILNVYLKEILKNQEIINIKLFGYNKDLKKIREYIEKKYQIETYIYSHPKLHPILHLKQYL